LEQRGGPLIASVLEQAMPNIRQFVNDMSNTGFDVCKYGMSIEGLLTKPA